MLTKINSKANILTVQVYFDIVFFRHNKGGIKLYKYQGGLLMALKDKFQAKLGPMQQRVKKLIKEHGDKVISEVTIGQAYGGMRGGKCIVSETSALDPYEGIRFRGYNIPQLQEKLPKKQN